MDDKKVDEPRSTNDIVPEKNETMIRYFFPILATLIASAVATYATYSYNERQMQLVHIEALDKYRNYINSDDYEKREYGYFVFEELGYSKLVDKLAFYRKDSAAIKALLSSERSSSAENIKARDIADKIMRIAVSPEQETIPSSVSTHDAGTSKEGWAYIGHFVDSKWKTRYFEIETDANPESLVGKTLNVREETGTLNVREGMPTFTGSFKSIIEALKPGSKAKILKVEEWSSSGYMWAQITYGT